MEEILNETLFLIETIQTKNNQLEQENKNITERIQDLEKSLKKEEDRRKQEEQKLRIEDQLRSLGESIEEKTVEDYLKNLSLSPRDPSDT